MVDESRYEQVATTMRKINRAWIDGRVDDLTPMVHPDIVMVTPGFQQRVEGREAFLAGFVDFAQNAKVHQFSEENQQVDIAGDTAVISTRYQMVYERSGERYRAAGRDLWVFQQQGDAWVAVWRTMLDVEEKAV